MEANVGPGRLPRTWVMRVLGSQRIGPPGTVHLL